MFSKGTVNSALVLYFFKSLYRKISSSKQNMTIVLDNARVHMTDVIKNFAIDTKTEFRFLPPRSPFMNLSELVFRYIKSGLRNHLTLK